MHRIDGPGHATNQFTEGNPATATPATVVTADWLNAVQEEIAGVIEGAGDTLDKPDNGQLFAAVQALIAASGSAWTTGDVKLTMKAAADSGWVLCNDGTIGDGSSAGTTRANADTEALFSLLWNNVADAWAPVSSGRGVSAAADFAAHKTIGLTKMLGRSLALSGTGATLTARALGENLGAETHALTTAELPANYYGTAAGNGSAGGGGNPSGTLQGGGNAHNNMQPTAFLNAMIKL